MCRIVQALSGRHRYGPAPVVARVLPGGAVLDGRATGAMVPAAAQLRVEGVEHLRAVELVEVARQQLVDGRARAGVAFLVDLADEAVASRPRLPLGLRTGRDDRDEVVPLLRDRVHAGVHAHAPGAARQEIDAAPLAA